MKVKNISNLRIYLADLKTVRQSQNEGRRGEDRYLDPGQSAYLQNTSEVLRSAFDGLLSTYRQDGKLELDDTVALDAAANIILTHNFTYPPAVYVLKQVGSTWVDATGTYDLVQNQNFTTVTLTNTTAGALTYLIRLL